MLCCLRFHAFSITLVKRRHAPPFIEPRHEVLLRRRLRLPLMLSIYDDTLRRRAAPPIFERPRRARHAACRYIFTRRYIFAACCQQVFFCLLVMPPRCLPPLDMMSRCYARASLYMRHCRLRLWRCRRARFFESVTRRLRMPTLSARYVC